MFADPTDLRLAFSHALSEMYRAEVPAYGALLDIVSEINGEEIEGADAGARLAEERHGAIRVGTAEELNAVARIFALMGLEPVGYYDLGAAGLPVHSTAFRPVTDAGLEACPFRVFTSLLRLDAIADAELRDTARDTLAGRRILSEPAREQLERAEAAGGVRDADAFVAAVLDTFRWHARARVAEPTYRALLKVSGLVADIVSFPGPHINHLTPRVADIDAAHAAMGARGLDTKAAIEGPPRRRCPVLLRQTAFRALGETVVFADGVEGTHTARFGEIESRGAALTPVGMTAYERAMADGDWERLPDSWDALRADGLVYWGRDAALTYEDFLPVSAAGIFRSNLAETPGEAAPPEATPPEAVSPLGDKPDGRAAFEAALGRPVVDRFGWYESQAHRT